MDPEVLPETQAKKFRDMILLGSNVGVEAVS